MAEWLTQQVQVVVFTPNVSGPEASSIYEHIWGKEPDQVQQNRVPTPATPFLGLAAGQTDARIAQVQVNPGRIDIISRVEMDSIFITPPASISLQDELAKIVNRISDGNMTGRSVLRLSVVADIIKPLPAYAECAKEFNRSLGFDIIAEGDRDLTFQVNVRKTFDGIACNRIVSFAVVSVRSISLDFANVGSLVLPPDTSEFLGAMRHLDFNTVPTGVPLDAELIVPTLQRLSAEVQEVSSDGRVSSLRN